MTAKQALKESYEHWLENWESSLTGKGKYCISADDCALCKYVDVVGRVINCEACILKEYGFECMQYDCNPYRGASLTKPETVGDMATLLLLIYLSEYGTHPNKN